MCMEKINITDCVREAAMRVCKDSSNSTNYDSFPDLVDIHDTRNMTCINIAKSIFEANLREAIEKAENLDDPTIVRDAVSDAAKDTLYDMRTVFSGIDQTVPEDYYRAALLTANDICRGDNPAMIIDKNIWPDLDNFRDENNFVAGTVREILASKKEAILRNAKVLYWENALSMDELKEVAGALEKYDSHATFVMPYVTLFGTYIECVYSKLLAFERRKCHGGHYNVQTMFESVLDPERCANTITAQD